MSNILLTGGKRFAARAAIFGLSALAVAVPATAARAVVPVFSVALSPTSSNAVLNVAVTYTVTARDANGGLMTGQNLNVELRSDASSPAQPLTVTGVAGVIAGGTSGAWLVTGTVTSGLSGTATYTVAASVPGSILIRVYAGTPPFTGAQASSSGSQFTTGPTGAPAVTSLSASPATATQPVGAGQSATVHAVDMTGTPVAGVIPVAVVKGANAGAAATCSTTDLTGAATCSYSNPNAGSDTFSIYVNQATGMTPGWDAGEPGSTVTRISQPAALPPTVTVPTNITRSVRTGRLGETVRFIATATDPIDGALTPVCVPPSGTLFPVGTTTVTCAATNSHGLTSSATFTITVVIRA